MELLERIARVIAGYRLSLNAKGTKASAGPSVNGEWHAHLGEALAILKCLREPSDAMVKSGMSGDWRALLEAEIALVDTSIGDPRT